MVAVLGDKKELQRRIWRGQVRVLLPYVEERRCQLLHQYQGIIKTPHTTIYGEVINDALQLEIGHIHYQFKNNRQIDYDTLDLTRTLLQIRNALSHLDIVELREIKGLFNDK